MVIVDANVLLYATNPGDRHHELSRAWLDEQLSTSEPLGFAWPVIVAFLRIATHPGVSARPMSSDEAGKRVSQWLGQPAATIVEPTSRHLSVLLGLIGATGTGGNAVPDAHLAALAVEHDAALASFDHSFQRFRGVRLILPGG